MHEFSISTLTLNKRDQQTYFLCGPMRFSNLSLSKNRSSAKICPWTQMASLNGFCYGRFVEWDYGQQRIPGPGYFESMDRRRLAL